MIDEESSTMVLIWTVSLYLLNLKWCGYAWSGFYVSSIRIICVYHTQKIVIWGGIVFILTRAQGKWKDNSVVPSVRPWLALKKCFAIAIYEIGLLDRNSQIFEQICFQRLGSWDVRFYFQYSSSSMDIFELERDPYLWAFLFLVPNLEKSTLPLSSNTCK